LRYRTYTDLPRALWALQWVWLHPFARHKGLFAAAWPVWLGIYGALYLELPASPAVLHIVRETPTRTLLTDTGEALTLYVGKEVTA